MAFESILAAESLLTIIAGLLTVQNFLTQRLKLSFNRLEGAFKKLTKAYKQVSRYLITDIKLRSRLEKKADWLMDKFGVDIEKFNIDAEEDMNGDYDSLLKELALDDD